eukprot:m.125505 g.125505  ORF g.125505 m.125505 type:complete len:88 (+) comp13801_c0_seq1:623-886(+)
MLLKYSIVLVAKVTCLALFRYGLLTLGDEEFDELQQGKLEEGAPIALIGAGTGLGECYLTCASGRYCSRKIMPHHAWSHYDGMVFQN